MEFNYREFLFNNGVVGTTIGTLLGFATKKVFDSFRSDILKPGLDIFYAFLFDTLNVPNMELISVLIEYCLIIFIVYLLSRFILFPILSK
jgi:large-conductance mechanosensitive channel